MPTTRLTSISPDAGCISATGSDTSCPTLFFVIRHRFFSVLNTLPIQQLPDTALGNNLCRVVIYPTVKIRLFG